MEQSLSNCWNMNTWVLNAASLQAHYTEAEASASSLFDNLWAPMAPDLNDEFKWNELHQSERSVTYPFTAQDTTTAHKLFLFVAYVAPEWQWHNCVCTEAKPFCHGNHLQH